VDVLPFHSQFTLNRPRCWKFTNIPTDSTTPTPPPDSADATPTPPHPIAQPQVNLDRLKALGMGEVSREAPPLRRRGQTYTRAGMRDLIQQVRAARDDGRTAALCGCLHLALKLPRLRAARGVAQPLIGAPRLLGRLVQHCAFVWRLHHNGHLDGPMRLACWLLQCGGGLPGFPSSAPPVHPPPQTEFCTAPSSPRPPPRPTPNCAARC
jgi:hypothetical protein